MRKWIVSCFIVFTVSFVSAQSAFKKNLLYAEAFGNGLSPASINYERQIKDRPGFGYRIGIGVYSENQFAVSVPVGIDYLINVGHDKSFIDAGAGLTLSPATGFKSQEQTLRTGKGEAEYIFSFFPSIGFRQHIIKDRVMWRLSLSAITNKYDHLIFPFAGLSAGVRF